MEQTAKIKVSANALSEAFVQRMAELFPTVQVAGVDVERLGGGTWRARSFLAPIPDPMLADAFALVSEMQCEFELVEAS